MSRTYTAKVQWLNIGRGGRYSLGSKTVRGIVADSILEARRIALEPFKDRCNPSVASIWYDWPQPKYHSHITPKHRRAA